jgi:23S rRNA pseudouridine1911/1915/1917 synthase
VVHRLDKDTSGLILMAKDDRTHRFLQRQFKRREVQKQYLALVDGRPPTPQGRIEAPVGRDPKHRKRMAVVPGDRGRRAVTVYRTLERFARHTLLALEPETGRTHQIRVHLAFLDCPVVGDTTYGQRSSSVQLDRHFLHASELGIRIPDEDHLRYFHAPLPEELEATLARLRAG